MSNEINNDNVSKAEGVNPMEDRVVGNVAGDLVKHMLIQSRTELIWRSVKRIFWSVIIVVLTGYQILAWANGMGYQAMPNKPTVAVMQIDGVIGTGMKASADAINPVLESLFKSEEVKAIVLQIRSGGGMPGEAERIIDLIEYYKKETKKPVIAVCDSMCASAAYMIAIESDEVIAGRYAWTGSIGAIIKGWDFSGFLNDYKVDQRVFASGERKDMMNEYKNLDENKAKKIQKLVNQSADIFVREVKAKRGSKLATDVDLFTGEVWTADDALKLGLIDSIGSLESVIREKWPESEVKFYKSRISKSGFFDGIFSQIKQEMFESNTAPVSFEYSWEHIK